MSKIFLSYRREETADLTGRLYDRLVDVFGDEAVFRDIYTIQGGADFPSTIEQAISSAEVVLAVIGERWLSGKGTHEQRDIDDPEDWVRLEIAAALEQKKLVVPVLVKNATMPNQSELPEPLRPLVSHHAMYLTDSDFDSQVANLIVLVRQHVLKPEPGAFRKLGSFHVHIDGADPDRIESLINELGAQFPSKVTRIAGIPISGPQKNHPDFAESYRYHTPGPSGEEEFSAFSTTLLGAGSALDAEAIDLLKRLIQAVTRKEGPVVELERVVATIDEDGVWRETKLISDPRDLWKLSDECEYPRLTTAPIEIHHAIDIRKREGVSPPNTADLPKGPNLGTWFHFEKEDVWAYRSNQFADYTDYEHYAKDGDKRIRNDAHVQALLGDGGALRTVVEQIFGIWRRDDEPRSKDFKSVPDLARWERECPEFWVIAANFLGDKSPDVESAMVDNLRRGVTYTYFVRSYADVFRLNMLRKELEEPVYKLSNLSLVQVRKLVKKNIRCVLLSQVTSELEDLLEPDYFICPTEEGERSPEGYELQRGMIGGRRIEDSKAKSIVEKLTPLLKQEIEAFYLSLRQEQTDEFERYAIVCTDLDSSARASRGNEAWQRALAVYDRIVARQVSMFHHGTVVRPARNGYLIVFKSVKDAAELAKRLHWSLTWHNEAAAREGQGDHLPSQVISLHDGAATRVLRAHGDDYIGGAVDTCIGQLDRCREENRQYGVIVMSPDFASSYKAEIGQEAFEAHATKTDDGWVMIV